jgi:hypothetical protein
LAHLPVGIEPPRVDRVAEQPANGRLIPAPLALRRRDLAGHQRSYLFLKNHSTSVRIEGEAWLTA